MSVIVHNSKTTLPFHMPLLYENAPFNTRKLYRQRGFRNVFVGDKKRLWNNYVRTRRAERAKKTFTNNAEPLNTQSLKQLNLTGSNWKLTKGEGNTVPRNLMPHRPVSGTRTFARGLRRAKN
jgi:hypothetical protein